MVVRQLITQQRENFRLKPSEGVAFALYGLVNTFPRMAPNDEKKTHEVS